MNEIRECKRGGNEDTLEYAARLKRARGQICESSWKNPQSGPTEITVNDGSQRLFNVRKCEQSNIFANITLKYEAVTESGIRSRSDKS